MIAISPFLTAYDPSDLPGTSIDPLGFERGYLLLAEKLLPGLTNVANRPRYFGVLCAGVLLADVSPAEAPRVQFQRRVDCVLRLERLWALANALVAGEKGEEEYAATGIRGLRYVQRRAATIESKGESRIDANFQVLARQMPYGVIGIYGSVAERLRLLQDRKTLALTPDFGDRLAEAFIRETAMPGEIRTAVKQDGTVAVSRLQDWGERAHVAAQCREQEGTCLVDALRLNSIRSRVADLLSKHPIRDGETELDRLTRMLAPLESSQKNQDLAETVAAIIAYEKAYSIAQLGLERLLWACGRQASVPVSDMIRDEVLAKARRALPAATKRLLEILTDAATPYFAADLHRLDDVKVFLTELSATSDNPEEFVDVILRRHRDVQHGKFDRGRRKAPWIESHDGNLSLTTTRVGGATFELTKADEVIPHYYRTAAADALRDAGQVA